MTVIVIDASALVCLLLREAGWERVQGAIAEAETRLLPASSYVECGIALVRACGDRAMEVLELACESLRLTVVPLDRASATDAVTAWLRYGRSSGHAARLNFGDCCTYATARRTNAVLVHLGNDFTQTDLRLLSI